ncbi:winged helix-turn-helix domain-containing protein [Streptomyces sp. NPDC002838]|uniref:ArsR/SmtB family transcription factor n=1 Tax=Streptomyces sp. NPDC002838 TaxID=3154436 RepID=UPI00331BFE1D
MTLAQQPEPLHETIASLRVLQQRRPGVGLGPWRRWAQARVPRSAGLLRELVRPHGAAPDFLAPLSTDFEAGLDTLLHTPRSFLRTDLEAVTRFNGRPLPAWTDALADGCPRVLRTVGDAMRDWHRAAVAPLRQHLHAGFAATRSSATRHLLTGGLDAMLSHLHPTISWWPPVLELTCPDHDLDIPLRGRGVRLVPSFFCGREPMIQPVPGLPLVVVYPVTHDTVWSPEPGPEPRLEPETRRRSLAALLGNSRATVLYAVAAGHSTTTDLAGRTGVSPATVSHHTTVLREAGLIITHRTGNSAHHLLTPLGSRFLDGDPPPDQGLPGGP